MKRIATFIIGALIACPLLAQDATTASTSSTATSGVKSRFAQLCEKKLYKQAVDEGVKTSINYSTNHLWKEAFTTCRQIDALIATCEQEGGSVRYDLRYPVAKERLRMYTAIHNMEQCKGLLGQLHTYVDQLKNDSLREDLLFTEGNLYHVFGQEDKSLACYKTMLSQRSQGKDEKGIDQCYQEMINFAQQEKNGPLTAAMKRLYTAWQDSIRVEKDARALSDLQTAYDASQQTLEEKDSKITTQMYYITALGLVSIILAAALLLLAALLMKYIHDGKKLRHSLDLANGNNELKSHFIRNIGEQISPTLDKLETECAGQRGKRLVTALKDLMAHIGLYTALEESRDQHYELKSLDIQALCTQIMDEVKGEFKPGVEAVLNVPRVSIKTNAEELEKVLTYLLRGAALHTESGKITLEFKKRSAHMHQFIVTDTGAGIPEEKRAGLFRPFGEVANLEEGDGMGLPICSLTANKLNGTLALDNEYKRGTRFVLELHA
jgi:signal transduction histidine kinase